MNQDFTATTHGITVVVRTFYLPEQSRPADFHFVWAYHITIINGGSKKVQLLRRTWRITDETGHTTHVHGDGVVGYTPVLAQGEQFEYTSGTPLATSSGFMTGKYHMQEVESGTEFDIAIPAFSLDSPHQDTRRH